MQVSLIDRMIKNHSDMTVSALAPSWYTLFGESEEHMIAMIVRNAKRVHRKHQELADLLINLNNAVDNEYDDFRVAELNDAYDYVKMMHDGYHALSDLYKNFCAKNHIDVYPKTQSLTIAGIRRLIKYNG